MPARGHQACQQPNRTQPHTITRQAKKALVARKPDKENSVLKVHVFEDEAAEVAAIATAIKEAGSGCSKIVRCSPVRPSSLNRLRRNWVTPSDALSGATEERVRVRFRSLDAHAGTSACQRPVIIGSSCAGFAWRGRILLRSLLRSMKSKLLPC